METPEERRRFIERLMGACGGRPPQVFIDHFIQTGILDGRLWPLRIPYDVQQLMKKP